MKEKLNSKNERSKTTDDHDDRIIEGKPMYAQNERQIEGERARDRDRKKEKKPIQFIWKRNEVGGKEETWISVRLTMVFDDCFLYFLYVVFCTFFGQLTNIKRKRKIHEKNSAKPNENI